MLMLESCPVELNAPLVVELFGVNAPLVIGVELFGVSALLVFSVDELDLFGERALLVVSFELIVIFGEAGALPGVLGDRFCLKPELLAANCCLSCLTSIGSSEKLILSFIIYIQALLL